MATAFDHDTPDAQERPPVRRGPAFALAAIFFVVQITLEHLPYAGITEWSFGVLCGVGGGVYIFWSKHARRWFWPAVIGIAAIDIGLILLQSRVGLEADLGKGWMGVVILSAGLTCLFLFWMGWLFDPHAKPRTAATRAVEIVIYGFVLVAVALVAFFYWAAQGASVEDPRVWQAVTTRQSSLPMKAVQHCLAPNGSRHRPWENLDATARVARTYDFGRGVQTVVTDHDAYRTVVFSTRHARTLTSRELTDAETCLQGGTSAN